MKQKFNLPGSGGSPDFGGARVVKPTREGARDKNPGAGGGGGGCPVPKPAF